LKQAVETSHSHTNRLISENSPYLLSHAHNPVDWYPWGSEALSRAKAENKPIFLSIGYAACHWCHVMERESFENPEIAEIMNRLFISIKVDREQRPDLDHIYMSFTTAMTGQGGWPMSVFLTPQLKPFFAGTYFPPDDRYGRPGFKKVLTELGQAYGDQAGQIIESSEEIFAEVERHLSSTAEPTLLTKDVIASGVKQLIGTIDHQYGGFGTAPKFPHSVELSLFLRHYRASGDLSYLQAAQKALVGMGQGGIYDHIGGGFSRYSVDAMWLVPHFEKMLYDNALLVTTYVEAFQITGIDFYRTIVCGVLDFILQEMTDSSGGFYSALDADSEGEEGKFYVWSADEIKSILGADADLFMQYYNVTQEGNFEGLNILNINLNSENVRESCGLTPDAFIEKIAECRYKLFEARAKRIRPLTDDKILTSWNGLALSAFCKGYQITSETRYLDAAIANAEFVSKKLHRDGRLTHSFREGIHSEGQFLEDYAYYLRGLIDLYESDIKDNTKWLAFARQLADSALELFMDEGGNLYLREANQADLIVRPKEENDSALPAPGSFFIEALLKLNRITGEQKYLSAAENGLRKLSGKMAKYPSAFSSALLALDYWLGDKIEIVLVGNSADAYEMRQEVYRRYLPHKVLSMAFGDKAQLTSSPLFEGRLPTKGRTTAYVCRNSTCELPVTDLEAFKAQLNNL